MAQHTRLIDSFRLLGSEFRKIVSAWEIAHHSEVIFDISTNHPVRLQFFPNYLKIYCNLRRLISIAIYRLLVIVSIKLYEFNRLTVS